MFVDTVREAVAAAEQAFRLAGISTSALDARVLVKHTLQLSDTAFYRELERLLMPGEKEQLHLLIMRRCRREPVAYLTGQREFYGLALSVSPAVLIPRPETELLVTLAIDLIPAGGQCVDVGTGSGAIACAVASHRPDVSVIGIDASAAACTVARTNVKQFNLEHQIAIVRGDLLTPCTPSCTAVLANLPYLSADEVSNLQPEIRYEPLMALTGGKDGLDLYRRLFEQLSNWSFVVLLCEVGTGQAAHLAHLAYHHWPDAVISIHSDLAGLSRLVTVLRPSG